MDLKEFVTESLVQIQEGVAEAIKKRPFKDADLTGAINPVWGGLDRVASTHIQKVEFDVAVTVSERSESKGGGTLKIVIAEIGAGLGEASEQSTVSHIKFSVPVLPPVQFLPETETQKSFNRKIY